MNALSLSFPRAQTVALALLAVACSPAAPTTAANETPPPAPTEPPPFQLAQPAVVMEASPPPPFTYWAPDGATIRNHPHVPGLWQAFVDGKNVATYFGDDCRASDYQRYVGRKADDLPAPPPVVELRESCETCEVNGDLRPNRMNIIFDEDTRIVTRIACY